MNIIIKFLSFLFVVMSFANVSLGEEAFLPGTEDIPLMKGFEALEESVKFDTPAGKLLSIQALSRDSQEKILEFYSKVLPNLGWIAKSRYRFQREKEELLISMIPLTNNKILVTFDFKPSNSP